MQFDPLQERTCNSKCYNQESNMDSLYFLLKVITSMFLVERNINCSIYFFHLIYQK